MWFDVRVNDLNDIFISLTNDISQRKISLKIKIRILI